MRKFIEISIVVGLSTYLVGFSLPITGINIFSNRTILKTELKVNKKVINSIDALHYSNNIIRRFA